MARAAKRQTLADRLKIENAALKAELAEVRKGGQQVFAGLVVFARAENWLHHEVNADGTSADVEWEWKGEGDPMAHARKFLGLDQEEN